MLVIILTFLIPAFIILIYEDVTRILGPVYTSVQINKCDLYDREKSGIFNGTYSDGTKNWGKTTLPDERCSHSTTIFMPDKTKLFIDEDMCSIRYDNFQNNAQVINSEFCASEAVSECRPAVVMVPYEQFKKNLC